MLPALLSAPVLGSLISGAANLFGQAESNKTSAANVAAQNMQNALEAQRNRDFQVQQTGVQQDFGREMVGRQEQFQLGSVQQQQAFQERMSNTAYQRSAQDMMAAGLNPRAMFGHGAAASSPFGSAASGATASTAAPAGAQARYEHPEFRSGLLSVADTINKTISNAVQVRYMEKMAEEIASLRVEQAKRTAETRTEEKRPPLIEAETRRVDTTEAATRLGLPTIINAARTAENEMSMNESIRRWSDIMGRLGRKGSDTIAPVSDLVGSARGVQRMFSDRWP